MILSNLAHERHYLVRYRFQIRNRRSANPKQIDTLRIGWIGVILFDNQGENGLSGRQDSLRFAVIGTNQRNRRQE